MSDHDVKQIDIEKVMAEIRMEAQAITASLPAFTAVNEEHLTKGCTGPYDAALRNCVQLTADVQNVISERPIGGRGGFLGRISIFIKKTTRKFLRFYITPIVDDQNRFNQRNVVCLETIEKAIIALHTQLEDSRLDETTNTNGCSLTELAILVRQTQARKLSLLERESNRLTQCNTASQQTVADLITRVEQQEKALELLRYECAILQKKAALADLK